MDFLKVKKFRKAHKPDPEKDLENINDSGGGCGGDGGGGSDGGGDNDVKKSSKVDNGVEVEDDDDDDFITNEVKRRLKELRKNSFMVLIPEEEEEELYTEDDGEEAGGETCSSEWRDVEAEGRQWWGGFDAVYEKYCERMLFYDKMIAQQLKEAGKVLLALLNFTSNLRIIRAFNAFSAALRVYIVLHTSMMNNFRSLNCISPLKPVRALFNRLMARSIGLPRTKHICFLMVHAIAARFIDVSSSNPSTPSPKSANKKLRSPLSCLSLKKIEEPDEEAEQLQQSINNPYQDLETAYVAQFCLTWEALHCQYSQLSQIVLCQPENPICYNHSAQQLQQFQVLLQRFIENEPFQDGPRSEIYARARNILPKLLQIPNIQGSDRKEKVEEESDYSVLARDIIRIIESTILVFRLFLKMDNKKHGSFRNLFGNQNPMATPLQQVQSLLEKKGAKLKELHKKRKGWKKNMWPISQEDVPLLFGLIDIKIISRVLRMGRISKEELFWCEEKMKKLHFCDGKLERDPSPILFPVLMKD
ncbi:Ribosomal protein L34Ae [Gossypium australe]|uniref:Ribosomal protein L34Ae n=1 Tax=Gossypium australe TaxID=47621 RepID=A0A5B6WBP5_9ROSI|nr:Ribosomal protein L34Ae [Gossypium australe]